ncbi:asparaginase [uncultured Helicobacter sp.]|uniref:asparaginase n=3 Tax=uncultured Helicobacter sp. TaxID=175537 RepID=UPI0026069829|nr:asparaginase [uncultured Helicobacter sp.]
MQYISNKPHIMIIATGGTIAGKMNKTDSTTTNYTSGIYTIDTLLSSIPQIHSLAHIHTTQLCNIDSADMSDDIWLSLARCVNKTLSNTLYNAVIITHGTDTMEESAFFLHLVCKSHKPIIFTGAMRAFDSIDWDGGKNLYSALLLAIHRDSQKRGVMLCMNDRILSARYASKIHTSSLESFASPCDLGYIANGAVHFHASCGVLHQPMFDTEMIESLPRVDILYSYANDGSSIAAKALFSNGTQGLVIAGSGAGSVHKVHKQTLQSLIKQGLCVVISSRINQGSVYISEVDSQNGFISSGDLNPQKARVLLTLALTQSNNPLQIATFFYT